MQIIKNSIVQVSQTQVRKYRSWRKCRNCHKTFAFRQFRFRLRWKPNWYWEAELCGSCMTLNLMLRPAECTRVLAKIKY
jgi:hypothetical protein